MKVTSINDHIKLPAGAKVLSAYRDGGFFAIVYEYQGTRFEMFYNQDGREVFLVEPTRPLSFWDKVVNLLKERYANPDPPSYL